MAFFITVMGSDLRNVLPKARGVTLRLFLALKSCSLSGITSDSNGAALSSFALFLPVFILLVHFFSGSI